MIFISAGHHESSPGATYGKYSEYFFTVQYADIIAELIGDRGVRVPNGTLKEKVTFINDAIMNANDRSANIAVEIHFNSAKLWIDQNANGVIDDGEMVNVGEGSETLYYPGSKRGKICAEIVQESLARVFPPNRGAKEGWYQMNPAKGPDFFLAKSKCTALIIEPEFIDNTKIIINNMDIASSVIADSIMEAMNQW